MYVLSFWAMEKTSIKNIKNLNSISSGNIFKRVICLIFIVEY